MGAAAREAQRNSGGCDLQRIRGGDLPASASRSRGGWSAPNAREALRRAHAKGRAADPRAYVKWSAGRFATGRRLRDRWLRRSASEDGRTPRVARLRSCPTWGPPRGRARFGALPPPRSGMRADHYRRDARAPSRGRHLDRGAARRRVAANREPGDGRGDGARMHRRSCIGRFHSSATSAISPSLTSRAKEADLAIRASMRPLQRIFKAEAILSRAAHTRRRALARLEDATDIRQPRPLRLSRSAFLTSGSPRSATRRTQACRARERARRRISSGAPPGGASEARRFRARDRPRIDDMKAMSLISGDRRGPARVFRAFAATRPREVAGTRTAMA